MFSRMIQQAFVDMENMFELLETGMDVSEIKAFMFLSTFYAHGILHSDLPLCFN